MVTDMRTPVGAYLSRRTAVEAAVSAIVTALISLIVFGPILKWIAVGWSGGDMLSTYVNAEVWRGFAYGQTTQFGFPLGMNLNMFPNIDITENLFAQLVTNLTGRPFVGINMLILLSFPLVAALSFLVIRLTGLAGPIAIALAVAFALIPFHWGRALGHTYLSTLYSLVTGVALVMLVGSGILAEQRRRSGRSRVGLIVVVALLCIVTAWTGLYYAAFTLLLGAAALAWRWTHGARWRALGWDATPFVAIGMLAVIGFLPGLLAVRSTPPLAPLSDRLPYESVMFAGNLAIALLPLPQSALPGMGAYNAKITEAIAAAPWGESNAITNHGTWVTTAALVVLIAGLGWRLRRRTLGEPIVDGRVSPTFIAYLIVVTLLFFIPWGLNYLFAGTVTAQIRGWNRLVPLLLLLFILGSAAVLARTRVATRLAFAIPVSLVILGLVAVDSAYPFRSAYLTNVREAANLTKAATAYRDAVNAAIPQQCGILQLPYMAYPEFGRIGEINDYDHFWTSLTNPGKSWSYGAVKNTGASVWASQLPGVPTADDAALLAANGFCAVHLDLRGTISEVRPGLIEAMTRVFGPAVASGLDGQWLLFPITVTPANATDAQAFLHQAFIDPDPVTMAPREGDTSGAWSWTTAETATFELVPTDAAFPVRRVRGAIQAPHCGTRPVTVTLSDEAGSQSTTLVAKPEEAAPFTLTATGSGPATLTVYAPGQGCTTDSGTPRFAQVRDLRPF